MDHGGLAVKSQALTVRQHAEIAAVLHEALVAVGDPNTAFDRAESWNAVRDVIARLCTLFDNDPGFDHVRFLSLAMNGKAQE